MKNRLNGRRFPKAPVADRLRVEELSPEAKAIWKQFERDLSRVMQGLLNSANAMSMEAQEGVARALALVDGKKEEDGWRFNTTTKKWEQHAVS